MHEPDGWKDHLLATDGDIRAALADARRIAVIGIKDETRADEPAHRVPAYLRDAGYAVVPVNPTIDAVFGRPAHAAVDEVEEAVDIVNVFRRPENIPAHVDEVLAMAERPAVFWMQLGIRDDASARRLAEAGIRVVQDRCIAVEHGRLIGPRDDDGAADAATDEGDGRAVTP